MSTKAVLITGANGEIGHGLVSRLREQRPELRIVAIDVHPLSKEMKEQCHETIIGDILDTTLIDRLAAFYDFESIYHLAAILSTKAGSAARLRKAATSMRARPMAARR